MQHACTSAEGPRTTNGAVQSNRTNEWCHSDAAGARRRYPLYCRGLLLLTAVSPHDSACAREPPRERPSHPANTAHGAQNTATGVILEEVLGKVYITKGALDTRWCHYLTQPPPRRGKSQRQEMKMTEKRISQFGIS
jgi:hypothetical protein